ncbi:toll/interleukin-1 receptor domain-containing protein [Croceitalea rosinachiae]|uniref:Toll/interleukin-1 receptor domain-containing protein n=1 Tax=Croceitalea rosinachiae TaxID=3075596 RepID=A0ABU3AGK4_9FLAO|nr:toll/interleukin-1 receptor domain-containing protein [Croceitalea sp. F388]MDT0608026.1 toll/interleukin-1 receptor domain-containing protein [Croceitalea sp. F388]
MKIFISHSSREKWIAKKISEELIQLGCETFLDEKDISTGKAIDDSINDHLGDSDDFVILLSEASLKSAWVLVELGGAIALKKNIIPILLFIGVNEIPDVISKYLARDLNDIDKYYGEVGKKLKGQIIKRKPIKKPKVEQQSILIGQRVKIVDNPNRSVIDLVDWNDQEMDNYLGLTAKVVEVNPLGRNGEKLSNTFKLDIDKGEFYWRTDWLIALAEN